MRCILLSLFTISYVIGTAQPTYQLSEDEEFYKYGISCYPTLHNETNYVIKILSPITNEPIEFCLSACELYGLISTDQKLKFSKEKDKIKEIIKSSKKRDFSFISANTSSKVYGEQIYLQSDLLAFKEEIRFDSVMISYNEIKDKRREIFPLNPNEIGPDSLTNLIEILPEVFEPSSSIRFNTSKEVRMFAHLLRKEGIASNKYGLEVSFHWLSDYTN